MNPKEWLRNLLRQTCLYFTICTAAYALITWIVNVDAERVMLDASRVLLFFLFSLLLAFAGGILHISKLNVALRRILHYLITLFAFFTCFMLPISPTTGNMLVGFALFTLLYLAIWLIRYLVGSRYRRLSEQEQSYQSQFQKKK